MLETRYQAPATQRRRDIVRFGWRYALPAAVTGIGAGQAWHAWRDGGTVLEALAVGGTGALIGVGFLVIARLVGLHTPVEVAATPAVAARVRRRRPWLFAALAIALGYVVWLLWLSPRAV
jgi:hypothetical protein